MYREARNISFKTPPDIVILALHVRYCRSQIFIRLC
jgi:hypothetical protein